ncbi:unnamed protein product, partial [Phaeothamnion confervicola]
MTYDPQLSLLAIAVRNGDVTVLGAPGIDIQLKSVRDETVCPGGLHFVEGGGLAAVSCDGTLRLWDLFSRQLVGNIAGPLWIDESENFYAPVEVTASHYPGGGRHLFLGTRGGFVHVAQMSPRMRAVAYTVPPDPAATSAAAAAAAAASDGSVGEKDLGRVAALACCPTDNNQLLIGFASGALLLWDFTARKTRRSYRFVAP